MIQDQARFIRESMAEVKFHLLLAAVFVSATILLFVRDWRTTLIATLAIPTSIVPTFLFMQYMGFTLNNITMLGPDPGYRHRHRRRRGGSREHLPPHGRVRQGRHNRRPRWNEEIALAVLATSLSLVVIFLPVAFMGGMVGRFFSSFGLTVAFAIVMSLFVSFTLTPMLCRHFLKLDPSEAGHAKSKRG